MQNDTRTHGLWEQSAPPAPVTPALIGDVSADVVVVGGGYTGLSTALHLAEAGVDVVLLEAVEIGFGGSGRNVGLVNAGMWVQPEDLLATLGPIYGERLLDLLGNAPQYVFDLVARLGIDCEASHAGTLHCAVGRAGLVEITERERQWRRRGAPVELLDAREAEAKVGSTAYAGALLDRRAGTIQPLAYARGLAHAAITAGARIHTGSPVIAADRRRTQWEVRTERGRVTADRIVVATDAYSQGPWAAVRDEQVHLPYFNFATPPLAPEVLRTILPEHQGCWDTKQVLSSFRLDRAGRLVFGSVGALRLTGMAVHRAWAERAARKVFPQLGRVAFESAWYGLIGMTKDNLPRLHRPADDVICFSGYNGRGIAPGTVFGRTIARHLTGQIGAYEMPLPITATETPTFGRPMELAYELGAQLVHTIDARL
ncbi:FAD-binding oxidoreductase [Siculibacillus lacustris]|uniref:FAD-binding oxidoreductase n=1 Tax=Siculibacillus lacustris TaxID=1549641 RepID=A0A4Q9VKC0_9HYPH|nr:FAD-binding oxidoreductase [Siculibacillus lacustris]TBW35345.1 FAD-binding oxidoreductase [Siculibacillus lacustris]